MDQDGIGQRYDCKLVRMVADVVMIPVIASGGVRESDHLTKGITEGNTSAVSLANLFHFIGHNLINTEKFLQSKDLGFPVPLWNF